MKAHTRIVLLALAALVFGRAAAAQSAGAWVKVAPKDEAFVARMPRSPIPQPQQAEADGVQVSGLRYQVRDESGATYTVWSLLDPSNAGERLSREDYVSALFHGEALYLDLVAKLAWQLLVRHEYEKAKEEGSRKIPEMSYRREFELAGKPAREYWLTLKDRGGPVYVCADGPHIYVVTANSPLTTAPQLKQFVDSFSFKGFIPPPILPAAGLSSGPGTGGGMGAGVGPGRGGNVGGDALRGNVGGGDATVDYGRPFTQKEVTQKAAITYKPEPPFTEDARTFNVTGVVRFRAVLNATGEVTNIVILKGLPHGLTWKALDALRRLKFQPAKKDGRVVSQYAVFEYNFNIY